jgi:enoyl-CoA hydratase
MSHIEYSENDRIGILTVQRPAARNALDWAAQRDFAARIARCAQSATLRVLIITGSGPTFVAGGDLKEQAGPLDVADGARLADVMGEALHQLTLLPVPVIAAINGDAWGGGCEIITACDLRLMRADARLHFVQARMGLTTGWGGTARLVRLVGTARALELLLTTRPVSADEAHQIGLVQRIVPAEGDVPAAARALAQELVRLPAHALAAIKGLVRESADLPLPAAYAAERRRFLETWIHPAHADAVAAFLGRTGRAAASADNGGLKNLTSE